MSDLFGEDVEPPKKQKHKEAARTGCLWFKYITYSTTKTGCKRHV